MPRSSREFEDRKRREFLQRVQRILDVKQGEAESLFSIDLQSSVRINQLAPLSAADIVQQMHDANVDLEPIPWRSDAYHLLSEKTAVSQSPLFQSGLAYLQNASSLIPPCAMDPQPGDAILDVCAAPGGKSSDIASLTGNDCRLWLNDGIAARLEKLREVVAQFFVRPDQITDFPGQYLTKHIDTQFDRILLDAQCSGEGMLNLRFPKALRFWSLARIRKFSRLQEKMLTEAFKLLRPGGVLVYSTCTLAPEENEAPIDRLLRIAPAASLEPMEFTPTGARPGLTRWQDRKYDRQLEHAMRIAPSTFHEAFFVCKIRKSD